MRNKRTILLIFATIVTLILAVVAVITSQRLQKLATVPVAPNVPVSKPKAADAAPNRCQDSFSVAALICNEGTCKTNADCGLIGTTQLVCDTKSSTCVNNSCVGDPDCICPIEGVVACESKKAFNGNAATGPADYKYDVASQIASGSAIQKGDKIVYHFTLDNNGETPKAITLTDKIPTGMTFVDGAGECPHANGTVTCTLTVPPKSKLTRAFRVLVADTAAPGNFVNTATVTPATGTGTASNCAITLKLNPPNNPNLACTAKDVYKDVSTNSAGSYALGNENKLEADTVVSRGQKLLYVIRFKNSGDATMPSATISDELSSKVKFVDADSGCNYNDSTRKVTCNLSPLEAGKGGQRVIRVQVSDDAAAGDILNTATVTPSVGEVTNCSIKVKVNPPTASPTPTPSPTPTARPTPTPTPAPGCNSTCTTSDDCTGDMVCDASSRRCRNAQCLTESDCTCPVIRASATPAPTTMPEAGNALPGFMFVAAGALLVILGVLVVGL